MLIIANHAMAKIGKNLALTLNVDCFISSLTTFSFNEIELNVPRFTDCKECILILGVGNDSNLAIIELILHIQILESRGIKKIILIIPYFFYCRQNSNDSIGVIKVLKDILNNELIKKIITIDLHSDYLKTINKDLHEITHYEIFKKYIPHNTLIVSPDLGGKRRMDDYNLSGFNTSVLSKLRIKHKKIIIKGSEEVFYGKDCIIIDDIVDSANTIYSAAKFLKSCGASNIIAVISHNLLNDKSILKVSNNISLFIITNTVNNLNFSKSKLTKVVDINYALSNYLRKII